MHRDKHGSGSNDGAMWRTRLDLISPDGGDGRGPEMIHYPPDSRRLLKTYLVAASGVVEFFQGSAVAVGHVITTTEEHQCTGIV